VLCRRDEKQDAVVFLRLTKFPESKKSIRITLDVAALQRFKRRDDKLNAGFVLKVLKLIFDLAAGLCGDHVGLIHHTAGQRRIIERKSNESREAENDCGNRYGGASHCHGL